MKNFFVCGFDDDANCNGCISFAEASFAFCKQS